MIVELRRYALKPGRRDELITLFAREFVTPQEDLGMAVLATFTDRDDPDAFVWLRGFPDDMEARRAALEAFYGGPVWKEHGPAANATMLDSDNVLLLKTPDLATPPAEVALHIFHAETPWPEDTEVTGALATLTTAHEKNTFPRLPVREGENALVALAPPGTPIVAPAGTVKTETFHLTRV